MFKRQKNETDTGEYLLPEIPEWEEVEYSDHSVAAPLHSAMIEAGEDEPQFYSENSPGGYYAYTDAYKNSGMRASIEIDGGVIDIGDFPALRMARSLDEPRQLQKEEEASGQENNAERDISSLIERYAEMDEPEEEIPPEAEPAQQQEELPELFLFDRSDEQLAAADSDEEELSEFTMESELALQREISGELFEYINTIKLDAEALVRSRAVNRTAAKQNRVYDPYNLHFNDRYDDTEEILENTPEISMEPKYRMED